MKFLKDRLNANSSPTSLLILTFFIVIMASVILTGVFDISGFLGGPDTVEMNYNDIGPNTLQIKWQKGSDIKKVEIESEGEGSFVNNKSKVEINEIGGRAIYIGPERDKLTVWAITNNDNRKLVETHFVSG